MVERDVLFFQTEGNVHFDEDLLNKRGFEIDNIVIFNSLWLILSGPIALIVIIVSIIHVSIISSILTYFFLITKVCCQEVVKLHKSRSRNQK